MTDKVSHRVVMDCFEMYLDEVTVLAKDDPKLLKKCGWTYDEIINCIIQTKSFVQGYLETLDE